MIRPSGTEPKIKVYCGVVTQTAEYWRKACPGRPDFDT
jgi:phosphomannomutase